MSTASASKSTGGTVRVALQLPSGALLQRIYGRETDQAEAVPTGQTRLQAHLPASTSLWDLLVSFEAQSSVNLTRLYDISGMFCMPVLVELQREFTGIAALRQTNLIKLGFGGGSSVLFRLDYRRSTLTDSDVQAALVEMNPTQAAVAVPPVVMPAAIATVAVKRAPNWLTVATDSARALLVECDAESSDSTLACLNTLSAILANLLKLPRQEAYRTLKPGNAVFQSRVGRWSQAVRFLNAIGFEAQQDSDVMLLVLSPNREPAYSELQTAAQFLKSLIDQRTAVPQLPVVETQQSDSIVEVSQSPDAGHESVSVVAIENMEIDADSSSSVPEKIETPTAVSLEQSSEMEVVAPESSPQTPCSSSAEVPISPIARPAMLVDEAKRTAAVEKLNSVLAAIRTEGAAALNAITALSGVCHNLLKQPDNTMFRQLNAENPKFIERYRRLLFLFSKHHCL
jgi:hypothetical protein